jgi:methylated-DNA-protein-cysteine methyltransferase-like protein
MSEPENSQDLPKWYEAVYRFVRTVPIGKVVTYGQAADAAEGFTLTARQVGAALRFVPEGVPWQRVVGAGGRLPIVKRSPELKLKQRRLLQEEGAHFLSNDPDCVDMSRSQWITSDASSEPSVQGQLFDLSVE